MTKRIVFFDIILLLVLTYITCFSFEPNDRLDNSCFKNARRPAAIFSHDLHNENAQIDNCAICHHVYEEGKLIDDQSSEDQFCSDCHAESSEPDNTVSLLNAYHRKCKECHVVSGKGPLLCGECHRK